MTWLRNQVPTSWNERFKFRDAQSLIVGFFIVEIYYVSDVSSLTFVVVHDAVRYPRHLFWKTRSTKGKHNDHD